MRINQFLATATPLSRRGADEAIRAGQVTIDGRIAELGDEAGPTNKVLYLGQPVRPATTQVIAYHKSVGVICSRRRQGAAPTIYDLLPPELAHLNPVGRLDKDSSGLLILTNDGPLHERLSHPRHEKVKIYQLELDRPLTTAHRHLLEDGVELEDGLSRLAIQSLHGTRLTVALSEGRNRQIRRTLAALGYRVTTLHRTAIGQLQLGSLQPGRWRVLAERELP